MSYKIVEHTADLRMQASGKKPEELFSSALQGAMAFLNPKIPEKSAAVRHLIKIESPDKTALLVDFLNEALSLSRINKESYDSVIFKKMDESSLEAEISGRKAESFGEDIKAATYHEADMKKNRKGEWETMLIFDI
jgi:SHS2 domain-containing protein